MLDVYQVLQNGITINQDTVTVDHRCSDDVWGSIKRCFQAYRAKWVGANSQCFKFPVDPTSFINHVIESQSIPELNPHSYYPTVNKEAKNCIFEHTIANPYNWKHLERKIRILEPSAGEGALALEILERFKRAGVEVELILCEIDPLNVLTLEAHGLTVHQGSFFDMSFDNIDLCIMNPPFNSLEWLKHIRHAQSMLNSKGALVGIIPTTSLYKREQQKVIDFRNECALFNSDPLTLEPGTFANALTTETRIVETRHPEKVLNELNDRDALIYHSNNLKITLENDGDFCNRVSTYNSLNAIKVTIKSFTKSVEFLEFNLLLTDKVVDMTAWSLANDKTVMDAYLALYAPKNEPVAKIKKPRRSFNTLLFSV